MKSIILIWALLHLLFEKLFGFACLGSIAYIFYRAIFDYLVIGG